jgi:Zn-dependent M28 family amino/carboxypeptidase
MSQWFWISVIATAALAAGLVLYVISMPGKSYDGKATAPAEGERELERELHRHVETLASRIGERNIWRSQAMERAAEYIRAEFEKLNLMVREEQFPVWQTSARNLEATLTGREAQEELVIVGAHYDTVPGSPGANDNASGVAAMLEIARLLRNSPPARTVKFVAFANEEPPFFFTARQGSLVYARECRRRGDRIVAMLSLETIGYYSEQAGSQRYPFPFGLFYPDRANFIGFVGNLSSRRLVRRCIATFRAEAWFPSQGVAAPGYLPGIYWSDHWAFWRQGYRAVMVTDTALFRYPYYHTPEDTADKLDYGRMARVVAGLAAVVRDLAAV